MPEPKVLHHRSDYRRHRAEAYDLTGNQLDAIAKGFRALAQQGFVLPSETVAWLDARDAVKTRFRKS